MRLTINLNILDSLIYFGIMGLKQTILKLLHRPSAIQSMQQRFESIQIDSIDKPEVQKESFQLGLAAGYTGRSIRNIEDSLNRIESNMVTKDWFKTEFQDLTPQLLESVESIKTSLHEHDSNILKRFDSIQEVLDNMQLLAKDAPKPLKEDLFREIKTIQQQIPLSPKMLELVSIVKDVKEISYEDLAKRLNVQISALRGLLSNTLKRTPDIERYTVGNKGWVKYKGD